jgi:hypothetical protein
MGNSWPLVTADAQIIKYDDMFGDIYSPVSIIIHDIKPTPSVTSALRICHTVWRTRYVFIVTMLRVE